MSTIKYPFGEKEVLQVAPSQTNVVNLEIKESTFVKVSKLGANTTINATASEYLEVGSLLVIYTFNVVGETHNTLFGSGFFGTDIDGVANKAHYATFMYDGTRFVQTATQVAKRDELETVSADMVITANANEITWVTTYTNQAHAPDEWVLDVKLVTSKPIPVGTKLTITGLTGGYEVETKPQSEFWLSDIMEAHVEEVGTRSKLNTQSSPKTIVVTASELPVAKFETTLYTYLVTSNTATEGGYEGDEEMENITILDSKSNFISLVED